VWLSMQGKGDFLCYDPSTFRFIDDRRAQVKVVCWLSSRVFVEAVLCIEFDIVSDLVGATNWYRVPAHVLGVSNVKMFTLDESIGLSSWLQDSILKYLEGEFERSE